MAVKSSAASQLEKVKANVPSKLTSKKETSKPRVSAPSIKERVAANKASKVEQARNLATRSREVQPEAATGDIVKTMFSRARAYSNAPDALKPLAAQGFISAYNTYNSGKNDPNSALYNPYSTATNYKAIEGLAQYGYDVEQMSEDDIRALLKGKRTTATGYSAAAPTKTSTAAENAAYWAQEYLDASERTSAAENELAQMQKAVDYYANTLGLSDAEIVKRIDASKDYPTLKKMQEDKAAGSATLLNRAIDYSGDDTVYGMIFSARNGGESIGNYTLNAGAYAAGFGAQYEADEAALARRDASNPDTYNPYGSTTTLEDLGLRYGVGTFSRDWLEQNKALLNTDEADDYRKVKTAVENSEKAEAELSALQEWVQKQQANGKSADEIREKMADEDFWDDYKTLKKMEEARQNGTALALGYGVDYTSGGFSSYIDSLYPEPVPGETEGGFSVSAYVEQGGDENILHNEVARWLNGRGTTSAEGEAFVEKYGWLFGGGVEKAAFGDTYIVDARARDSRLGKTAYEKLAMAQDAAAEGVLSDDDYVTFTLRIAQQMEQAEKAGMSLEDYLSEGQGSLPDIGTLIEDNRALKTVQEEERTKAAAQQMRTAIEEADAAFAQGRATAQQKELVKAISSMDVVEAVAEVPGNAAQRKGLSAELTAYAETNMVGKLVSVYGAVHTVEADIAREAADNIANIALGYYDDNYKRAAMMGVDMDTYYEMYPERALSVEDAYKRAYDDYVNTWSNVWATVGKQAEQAAAGQMVIPQDSLRDTLVQAQKDSAAFDESADKTEYQGEGVGALRVAKSSAIAGSLAAAEGTVSAVQYFITSANDSAVEAANRATYQNDPAAYREAMQTAVADIADPEEQAAWQYLLDNYEGDIFNITMNFSDERVKSAMRAIQQNAAEVSEFMAKHGTEAENAAFRFGTSAVSNAIYMAETGAMAALGVPGAAAAAITYGAPSGAEMGRRLEEAGLSEAAAKGAALGYAVFTGWLESSTLGEYLPDLAGKGTTSLVKRGYSWLTGKSPETMSKALNWLVSMPVTEGVQEGLEYASGAAYEGVWQSIAAGDLRGAAKYIDANFSRDELLDNAAMGALMAPLLGAVGTGMNVAGKAVTSFKSVEAARNILEQGSATAKETQEFIEALAEDAETPEFVAAATAAATETMRAEAVVEQIQQGAMAEVEQSAEAQRAAEAVKQADESTDIATQARKQHEAASAQMQVTMDEFLQDPSNEEMAKQVAEQTATVADLSEKAVQAQQGAEKAQAAAEEATQAVESLREAKLGEIREGAKAVVREQAQAEQPAKTTMRERDLESIKGAKVQPYIIENPEAMDYMSAAAEILWEDVSKSTPGQRFMLVDGQWTGQKRSTTAEIGGLLDRKMSWDALKGIVQAYATGDTDYISKHKADAKKLELVLNEMLAEGYTDIEGNRLDPMDDWRELMGYEKRTEAPVPTDENGDLRFYQGRSTASRMAEQAARRGADGEVQSPVRVMTELAGQLGFGKYTGPRGSEARFARFSEYMQTDAMHAADYWRNAHEIGHGLAKRLDMTATPAMVASGEFSHNAEEAFAEFVAVYMADRGVAAQLAGDTFVRDFERRLLAAGVYGPVNAAATQMRMYIAAGAEAKIDAQIVNRSDTRRRDNQRLRRFMTRHIDHAFAGRAVDELAGNPEYGLEDAMHYREHHKRTAKHCLTGRLVDWNGNAIGESFASMLANNGITVENVNELVRYKVALHALDRAAAGTPVFGENVTEADLLRVVDGAPAEIAAASAAWDGWWNNFASNWLVASGVVTAEDYAAWHEMYPHYIPTVRDVNGVLTSVSAGNNTGSGGWVFHAATGSDLDIINPLDSIAEYVGSIVNRVAQNTVAQKFDQLYQQNDGMGIFAKAIPVPEQNVDMQSFGEDYQNILQVQYRPDVIVVQREDGTRVAYQFSDPLLLESLRSMGPASIPELGGMQAITRTLSALTTSMDPAFGARNAMRDFAKAVTYGSFAANEVTGGARWARNLVRVARGSDATMEEYEDLGGGGWGVLNTGSAIPRAQLRSELVEGYRGENLRERTSISGRNVLNTLTLNRVNEVLEQTTRVTEFDSAQNRALRATGVEGRRKAFLAAQDVTVDFARYGSSQGYTALKAVIPFYGPTMQGLAQQAQIIADAFGSDTPAADRQLAWQRIAKTATTYGLRAALQIALVKMFFDDDDREAYDLLADELKGQNLIFPTKWLKAPLAAAGVFSEADAERQFIRIPMAQGILDNTLYAGFLDSMSNLADVDEASICFLDVASRVLGDALPVDLTGFSEGAAEGFSSLFQSTIFAVPVAVASNRNWYGSPIVSESMERLHVTQQYNETTPTLFVDMANALYNSVGFEVSPLVLQYMAEQYTGFFGKVVIPFISRDQATGKWNATTSAQNVLRKMASGYTVEPLYSNDISNAYYDYATQLDYIVNTDEQFELPGIRVTADREQAYADAQRLQKEYDKINDDVKALTKEINAINADASLTRAERAMAVRVPTEERLKLMDEFLGMYTDYMQEYGHQDLWSRWFDLSAK